MEILPQIAQVVCFEELAQGAAPPNQETGGQQEVLKVFWYPQQNKENPELMEPVLWEDPQAFLASFEQVAKACHWPREEWAARLLPALSGDAKKSFSELGNRDREDYGKVKTAILQGDAIKRELQRQCFRQFSYCQAEDPQRVYSQLQELCHQWLKPERHTKEQILELLILEQFQAILPQEIQMKVSGTNTCLQAITLVGDFLNSQEVKAWQSLEPMQEAARSSSAAADIPSELAQSQIYKEAKQKNVGDLTLPSGEMTQDSSRSLRDLNGWEVTERDLTEEAMDVKSVAVPLNEAEQAVLDCGQCPMYWEVLEEGYRSVDSSGVLIPKMDAFPALGQEEIAFIQVLEDTETFPNNFIGDSETDKSREVLPPKGKNELKEIYHTPEKVTRSKVAVSHGEKCESEGLQEGKPAQTQIEYIRLSEGDISLRDTTKHMWVKKLLYSQGARTCPNSPLGLMVQKVSRKKGKLYPCPICGKTFFHKAVLEDHQCVHTGNKLYECSSCGKKFRWRRWVVEHQRIHTGERPYKCSKCGKSFRWRAGLRSHQGVGSSCKDFL